jgi:hypothetical protein
MNTKTEPKKQQQTQPTQDSKKPGQDAVGPHNKTQQEQNEERDERATR